VGFLGVLLTQFLSGRWGCLLLTHLNIIRNFNWFPLLVCVCFIGSYIRKPLNYNAHTSLNRCWQPELMTINETVPITCLPRPRAAAASSAAYSQNKLPLIVIYWIIAIYFRRLTALFSTYFALFFCPINALCVRCESEKRKHIKFISTLSAWMKPQNGI